MCVKAPREEEQYFSYLSDVKLETAVAFRLKVYLDVAIYLQRSSYCILKFLTLLLCYFSVDKFYDKGNIILWQSIIRRSSPT